MIHLRFLCLAGRINERVLSRCYCCLCLKKETYTRMNRWVTKQKKFSISKSHHMSFFFVTEWLKRIEEWWKTWQTQRAFSRMKILRRLSPHEGHRIQSLQHCLAALMPSWLAKFFTFNSCSRRDEFKGHIVLFHASISFSTFHILIKKDNDRTNRKTLVPPSLC